MSDFPMPLDWGEIGIPEIACKEWGNALGHFVSRSYPMLWEDQAFDWKHFIADRHVAMYNLFNGLIDSPIEQMLGPWLLFLDGQWCGFPDTTDGPWQLDPAKHIGRGRTFFGLCSQAQLGKHRVDFLITVAGGLGVKRLVIECDGHDFHEKTKEQASRDKKRDRDLVQLGCVVMRFTGSEIWKDARGCFDQLREVVADMAWSVFEHDAAVESAHA